MLRSSASTSLSSTTAATSTLGVGLASARRPPRKVVQNDRLPACSVMQLLFLEHDKLNRLADLGARIPCSPTSLDLHSGNGSCPYKREALAQHREMRHLREDVARLQVRSLDISALYHLSVLAFCII